MKDKTAGVAVKELVELKLKMHYFFLDNGRQHKKVKGVSKNVAAAISHGEYKDVLPNNKYLRHSMYTIQSKNQRIGTYDIKKFLYNALMIKYKSKTIDVAG